MLANLRDLGYLASRENTAIVVQLYYHESSL